MIDSNLHTDTDIHIPKINNTFSVQMYVEFFLIHHIYDHKGPQIQKNQILPRTSKIKNKP